MPIGADVYGRLFNVIGDAIDGLGNLPKTGENNVYSQTKQKIRRPFNSSEVLFTGIKVIDLLSPQGVKLDCSVVLVLVKQY
jgi:F-type H+-transporting ATPase subunit beta